MYHHVGIFNMCAPTVMSDVTRNDHSPPPSWDRYPACLLHLRWQDRETLVVSRVVYRSAHHQGVEIQMMMRYPRAYTFRLTGGQRTADGLSVDASGLVYSLQDR